MATMKTFLYSRHPISLVLKYTLFAAISIAVNLGSQYVVNSLIDHQFNVFIALIVGTGLGLIVKYVLDKRYIFFFITDSPTKNLRTFILYTAMGLITTAVFWGMELLFHYLIKTETAKYWGGLLGLLIGYCIKYLLDRKLVFQAQNGR